jgi:autotransporter-associated beta strand protein
MISGNGGSIVKSGAGTLTLSGANSYTGETVVQGGTLVIGRLAQTAAIGEASAGTDVQSGVLVFSYAGGTSPASEVLVLLDAAYDQADKFGAGKLRSTTLLADHLLGWREDATAETVTVLSTLAGDANLDLVVNFDDLLLLAQNYGAADKVWSEGDSNYDGEVNFDDLLATAQHYGMNAFITGGSPLAAEVFLEDWSVALAMVPEPTAMLFSVPIALMAHKRVRRER